MFHTLCSVVLTAPAATPVVTIAPLTATATATTINGGVAAFNVSATVTGTSTISSIACYSVLLPGAAQVPLTITSDFVVAIFPIGNNAIFCTATTSAGAIGATTAGIIVGESALSWCTDNCLSVCLSVCYIALCIFCLGQSYCGASESTCIRVSEKPHACSVPRPLHSQFDGSRDHQIYDYLPLIFLSLYFMINSGSYTSHHQPRGQDS